MKITLTVTRARYEDKIMEYFTWNPRVSFVNDPKRQIYHIIRNEINKLSIHKNGYTLIDIHYFKDQIIYIYKDSTTVPQKLIEQRIIEYFPILGKKTCSNCLNIRRYHKALFCFLKGIQLEKNSGYKCLYWMENGEKNVHFKRRPETNDKSYQ